MEEQIDKIAELESALRKLKSLFDLKDQEMKDLRYVYKKKLKLMKKKL